MNSLVKKICLIGPEGVGKTSLIRRFVDNSFDDEYRSTIGVQISQKVVNLSSDQSAELIIWDLEGFDISKDYPLSYLLGAASFIFVADISRPNTISELSRIYTKIMSDFKLEAPPVIVLNKSDLIPTKIHSSQLNKMKTSKTFHPHAQLFLTSAKIGKSVEAVFQTIAGSMFNDYD